MISPSLGSTAEMLVREMPGGPEAPAGAARRKPAAERRQLERSQSFGYAGSFSREEQIVWDELCPFSDKKSLATNLAKLGSAPRVPSR